MSLPRTKARPAVGPAPRVTATGHLRRDNLADVVRHLHLDGPLSRSDLAARTGLNRSTVADLVGALTSIGLVRESAPSHRTRTGRPSLMVKLDAERVWALAVELATDTLAVARVGLGGHVYQRLTMPFSRSPAVAPEDAASAISALGRKLAEGAPARARMVGAAVAVPGIVRRQDGFVHLAPNLRWHNVAFGALLSRHTGGPSGALFANEADLGTLAECARGAAVGFRHVVYVSGNSGVGAGIVLNGELLAGRSGYAGEVGHMKVNPGGRPCHCGGRGCWESEIGAAALLRRAGRDGAGVRAGLADVLSAARAGDPTASEALEETGRWVGRGAANLINIFNPDIVVFGGELRSIFLAAKKVVTNEIRLQALGPAAAEVKVVGAGLGVDSTLLGAAELAFSSFLADPVTVAVTAS